MKRKFTSVPDNWRITVADAVARLPGPNDERWAVLFRHGSLEVEIYAPRGEDVQKPHTRDEVYFVVHGTGEFVVEDTRRAFGPGDFLFVPAQVAHRFDNFTDDLAVWVIFYGPEGGEQPA